MKKTTSWVLLADGAHARIVRWNAASKTIDLEVGGLVFEGAHKQLREIMSDRPGRSFASEGARRSAMEYRSDPEKEQEMRFAGTIVEELERRLRAHEFERLTIVAEPRMLGALRQKLSPALERTIVEEIAKDLTKVPTQELDAMMDRLGIK